MSDARSKCWTAFRRACAGGARAHRYAARCNRHTRAASAQRIGQNVQAPPRESAIAQAHARVPAPPVDRKELVTGGTSFRCACPPRGLAQERQLANHLRTRRLRRAAVTNREARTEHEGD